MEANQLPTKPGPYYWRESEGDEYQLVRVELHLYNRNPDVVHLSCYSGKEMRMLPIKDMQGEWLPIPTAEELVELQPCPVCGAEAEKWNSIPRRSKVLELLNKLEFAMLTSDWNRQDELEDLQRCATKLRKEMGE